MSRPSAASREPQKLDLPTFSNEHSYVTNRCVFRGDHMKAISTLFACVVLVLGAPVQAQTCTGTGAYRFCTDASGNSYSVNRIGSSTFVNGSNASTGSSWSQNTQRIGNSSFTNGYNSQGQAWNSTSTTFGNTTIQNGSDSAGRAFSSTVTRMGDTSFISATDGSGRVTTKTCTSLGCF